eukprot:15828-Rhodomonas_salina.3
MNEPGSRHAKLTLDENKGLQITDEVMGGEDLGLPAEGPERVQAEKEVGIQVKRFVSEQYGAWLRADQAAR